MTIRRYPTYEVRQHPQRGFYIVGDDGHLAHVPDGNGGLRAAFFTTQEEADAARDKLNGTLA